MVSYWGLYEVDSFRVDQIWHHWWPWYEMHDPPLASAMAKAPTHAQLVKWRFQKLKLQRRKHVSRGGAGWVTILICEIAGYLGKSPAREWEVHQQRMFGEIRLYCALCQVWPHVGFGVGCVSGFQLGTESSGGAEERNNLRGVNFNTTSRWKVNAEFSMPVVSYNNVRGWTTWKEERSVPCTASQKMSPSDAKKGRLTSVGVWKPTCFGPHSNKWRRRIFQEDPLVQ